MPEQACCGPFGGWIEGFHGWPVHHHGHGCCCPACCCGWGKGGAFPCFMRRFPTKEERIAALEAYLEALRKEARAVEEKIRSLREE